METTGVRTRHAMLSEHEQIVDLCTTAFADEPLTAWIHPDEATRREHLRLMFDASLQEAIGSESVIVAVAHDNSPLGASIWHQQSPLPSIEDEDEIPGDDLLSQRLRMIQKATDGRRPQIPHLYLPSMAVRPQSRRLGIGGMMLAAGFERAAASAVPVYLEASSPDNRRFYARHGFSNHDAPIHIADDAPTLQPMWRELRSLG